MFSQSVGTLLYFAQSPRCIVVVYTIPRYISAFVQLKIFFSVVNAVGMSGFYWIQVLTAENYV